MKGGGIMSKNITELTRQYQDLIAMADRLQSRKHLTPAGLQILAGTIAKISMLELQIYGDSNIYCSSRRKAQTQSVKTPF